MTKQQILAEIARLYEDSPLNFVTAEAAITPDLAGMKIFDAPIVGFGAAVERTAAKLAEFRDKAPRLREVLVSHLPEGARVNQPISYAPHIVSVTLPRLRSETVLHFLSAKGIFVSSGSACASNKKGANYVLPAFGLAEEDVDTTLRISFSNETTEEELITCANAIAEAMESLIKK